MSFVLNALAPGQFPQAVASPEVVAQAAAAAPEPTAEVEPTAEPAAEEPTVEGEPEAEPAAEPAAEEPPAEEPAAPATPDPRVTQLEAQVAQLTEALKGFQTAEAKAKVAGDIADIKTNIGALKAAMVDTYGEDSPMVAAMTTIMEKMVATVEGIGQKADQAAEVTVQRDETSAHKEAWKGVPVMSALYAARDANPKDIAAQAALSAASVISDAILDEAGIESINWRDTKALVAHYSEVEKRLTENFPELRQKFIKPPTAVKPATPAVKAARVKGPDTMTGINGGKTPMPAKPVELSKMNMKDLARLAVETRPRAIAR